MRYTRWHPHLKRWHPHFLRTSTSFHIWKTHFIFVPALDQNCTGQWSSVVSMHSCQSLSKEKRSNLESMYTWHLSTDCYGPTCTGAWHVSVLQLECVYICLKIVLDQFVLVKLVLVIVCASVRVCICVYNILLVQLVPVQLVLVCARHFSVSQLECVFVYLYLCISLSWGVYLCLYVLVQLVLVCARHVSVSHLEEQRHDVDSSPGQLSNLALACHNLYNLSYNNCNPV